MTKIRNKVISFALLMAFVSAMLVVLTMSCTFVVTQAEGEKRYGSDASTYQYEPDGQPMDISFNYARKTEEKYTISGVPRYYNQNSSNKNTCANVSGACIISYYTPKYTTLMDGYMPAVKVGDNYIFRPQGANVQQLINNLHTLMGTTDNGTTKEGFYNGMSSYLNARNHSISYTSVNPTNVSKIISVLANDNIFVGFFNKYNFVHNYTDNGLSVQYSRTNYTADHMAVLHGYTHTIYYNSNNDEIGESYIFDIIDGVSRKTTKLIYDIQVSMELCEVNIQGM